MRCSLLLCAGLLIFGLAVPAAAEVDWEVVKTLPLEGAPRDVAVSSDGKTVYVLIDGGEVRIYAVTGRLQETLSLEGSADDIALSPDGNLLLVTSRDKKTLQTIRLEFVQKITSAGSPFKGPADATVTVAVFSDFQ